MIVLGGGGGCITEVTALTHEYSLPLNQNLVSTFSLGESDSSGGEVMHK